MNASDSQEPLVELGNSAPMSREAEVLRILLDVSKVISSKDPMRAVVKKMSGHLRKLLAADECSIMIMDETRRELAFCESSGLSRWEVENIRFKLGEGVAGWVAKHKESVLIENVSNDPRFISIQDQNRHIVSMICVPLMIKRHLIGTISLTTHKDDHIFTTGELEVAALLSAHVSLALENNRLYELSVLDGLTNIYNRRYLEQRLAKEMAYSRRFQKPLTVLLVDIDFFKRLNDTYGHQAGDHALREVSEILTKGLREYDVVARYGGEEFAIILPSTPRERGAIIAERLRESVEAAEIVTRGHHIKLTVSVGLSSHPEDATEAKELVHLADKALYQAKHRGRNQVVHAGDWGVPEEG
jgi:diguanylate cyclase (GGDEF)-like protein